MKLGIFLPNWIGDVVMATPALRALRKHYGPQARIVGIMRPYVADVLVGTNWIDDRIFFDPRSKNRDLHGWRFAQRLRQEQFDSIILLTNSLRTAFWAWTSGAPQRVGYARDRRSAFLTHKLYAPMAGGKYAPQPTLDAYLRIAYALGCPKESVRMELATTAADEQAADDVWQRLEIPADKPVVLLNSGAAFGASKLWPTEYFGELARRIAADWGYTVLVICGPRERPIVEQITAVAAHPNVVSLADPRLGNDYPLPIGLSKACVRRATLMVTTDSGPRHFAPAFDVPVVTLFGPTHISLSETHFAKAIHLQHKVPCGPCMEGVCPLVHHRCMRELGVDEVYRAVAAQLNGDLERGFAASSPSPATFDDDSSDGGRPLVIPGPHWQPNALPAAMQIAAHGRAQASAVVRQTITSPRQPAGSLATMERATPVVEVTRPATGDAQLWINPAYRELLAEAGLADFDALMGTTAGRLMRALPDRENWWLRLGHHRAKAQSVFLKKHHVRNITTWLLARAGQAPPPAPGRVEAENVMRLEQGGIRAMPVIAFGERLHRSGLLESFLLTAELVGYRQLDHFLAERIVPANRLAAAGQPLDREFARLSNGVADVARRFHALGFNHRDLYCCHFFVCETAGDDFDVRLIDLQRVQQRSRGRRRWIVKDLAQLAFSAPRLQVSRSRKLAFFKAYLGVKKLRPADKRLARSVLRKQRLMESKLGPQS